jgi:hypothetical protein
VGNPLASKARWVASITCGPSTWGELVPSPIGRFRSAKFSQDSRKSPSYFSQLCVQFFLFGHKLQCLIEKSFFFGFADVLGLVSTRISAGSSDSGHFTIFLI